MYVNENIMNMNKCVACLDMYKRINDSIVDTTALYKNLVTIFFKVFSLMDY